MLPCLGLGPVGQFHHSPSARRHLGPARAWETHTLRHQQLTLRDAEHADVPRAGTARAARKKSPYMMGETPVGDTLIFHKNHDDGRKGKHTELMVHKSGKLPSWGW